MQSIFNAIYDYYSNTHGPSFDGEQYANPTIDFNFSGYNSYSYSYNGEEGIVYETDETAEIPYGIYDGALVPKLGGYFGIYNYAYKGKDAEEWGIPRYGYGGNIDYPYPQIDISDYEVKAFYINGVKQNYIPGYISPDEEVSTDYPKYFVRPTKDGINSQTYQPLF